MAHRAGVCARLDDGQRRFAAGLGGQLLDDSHQHVRREHPAQTRGDDLVSLFAQGAAGEVREDAQAVGGVVGAAGDDAVVPGTGHDARRIEAGVQDGHDLAAGDVSFPHHAQQIALVADDSIIDGHTVQCASVQREAPERVQRVAANDERGRVAHLRVLLLNVGQRLVGLVLGLELVIVHHLGAQRGVFLAELLVFFQNGVDVGVVLPQGGHAAAHRRCCPLERGYGHAQQLLRGSGQASVCACISHDAHEEDRDGNEYLKFPCVKKILQGGFLPNLQKSADSRAIRAQNSSSAAQQRKGPPSAYRRKWHS